MMKRSKSARKAYRKRQLNNGRARNYKQQKGCAVCGELDVDKLELHSRYGHKGGRGNHVSRLIGRGVSWKRIIQEIRGCDVLCHTHHIELHQWRYALLNV